MIKDWFYDTFKGRQLEKSWGSRLYSGWQEWPSSGSCQLEWCASLLQVTLQFCWRLCRITPKTDASMSRDLDMLQHNRAKLHWSLKALIFSHFFIFFFGLQPNFCLFVLHWWCSVLTLCGVGLSDKRAYENAINMYMSLFKVGRQEIAKWGRVGGSL